MSEITIPDAVSDPWFASLLSDRAVRRDLAKYVRSVDSGELARTAELLVHFDRPALVVWGAEDRLMPHEHGKRLATLLPQGRYTEIAGSGTLIPLDQRAALAAVISEFAGTSKAACNRAVAS